jgi:hypothetical protein
MSYNKTVNDFQFRWIQGLINTWNMPRWISCSMGWSILVFTSSKVINCILLLTDNRGCWNNSNTQNHIRWSLTPTLAEIRYCWKVICSCYVYGNFCNDTYIRKSCWTPTNLNKQMRHWVKQTPYTRISYYHVHKTHEEYNDISISVIIHNK